MARQALAYHGREEEGCMLVLDAQLGSLLWGALAIAGCWLAVVLVARFVLDDSSEPQEPAGVGSPRGDRVSSRRRRWFRRP